MTSKRDVEFMFEVGALRFLQRNWKQFLGPQFQNITEHTIRVIWISLILAKKENVTNTEKIMKLALVHDIAESRTGDTQYVSRLYNEQDEDQAIKDIFQDTLLAEEFMALAEEYEKRESPESKIVKDADILDVDLELQEQSKMGCSLREEWKPQRNAVYNTLYTESAKEFWKEIRQANPHDWHLSKNRLTHGDWKDV